MPIGERNGSAKLCQNDIIRIREMYFEDGYSTYEIARYYNVSRKNISKIINNITWRHVHA
jgi:predicted DNA-binding protein YlxM (UPF0122 family)